MASDELKVARKECRELRRHLRELTAALTLRISEFDEVGKDKSIPRAAGTPLAKIVNAIELANDRAKYFGLGIAFDDPAFKDPTKTPRRKPRSRSAKDVAAKKATASTPSPSVIR